ncbi:MAG: LysR family transcriptional regulator [Synergistaceae bacterium]|nr:LysR family transcriptional regulator [Synergistaceae bacterium]
MNLKLCEYMLAIKRYGNISEAAKKVFVTPSALNQQLLKLENELGTQLFVRSRRSLIPTEAGNAYLECARKMLDLWQATSSEIQDMTDCKTGSYRIGLTVDHGNEVFTHVYPAFYERYPEIQVQCWQMLVPELMRLLLHGDIDMMFTLGVENRIPDSLEYLLLSCENLLLGLHRTHPISQNATYSAINPAPDFRMLKDDKFALCLKNSTMRTELIDPMFKHLGFTPNIMVESSSNAFLEQLAAMGLCNAIIPQSQIRNHEDIAWFYLPQNPRFHFGAVYAKGYRLSKALRYFIGLAEEYARRNFDFAAPSEDCNIL